MKKIHGILGALIVLVLTADIILFFVKDNSFRDKPLTIFTEFAESAGGR